ncbi:hypothetical protein ACIGO6_40895 [Streptomyces sp. NPDC053750]|uniref:hypothetical protein n=1 Tax=Streptomyces sp. NPDC053750 TaxID=3365714 RepID=UPI0037D088CE
MDEPELDKVAADSTDVAAAGSRSRRAAIAGAGEAECRRSPSCRTAGHHGLSDPPFLRNAQVVRSCIVAVARTESGSAYRACGGQAVEYRGANAEGESRIDVEMAAKKTVRHPQAEAA